METAAWLPNGVADILQKDLGGVLQPFCISGAERCNLSGCPLPMRSIKLKERALRAVRIVDYQWTSMSQITLKLTCMLWLIKIIG